MEMECIKCKSNQVIKAGLKKLKNTTIQRYKCKKCLSFFTGKEKYTRLTEREKVEILMHFKKVLCLNQTARDFNVSLYTVQYIINKVRRKNSENEKFYQEKMKNRIRTKQEIYMINKKNSFKKNHIFSGYKPKLTKLPMPSYSSLETIPKGMPQYLNNNSVNKDNVLKEYTTKEIIDFDFG